MFVLPPPPLVTVTKGAHSYYYQQNIDLLTHKLLWIFQVSIWNSSEFIKRFRTIALFNTTKRFRNCSERSFYVCYSNYIEMTYLTYPTLNFSKWTRLVPMAKFCLKIRLFSILRSLCEDLVYVDHSVINVIEGYS